MRKPEPWFHKQSGNWKVQFGSKQLNLGKDESAAYEKYYKLMAERGLEARKSSDPTVHEVLNDYLAWCEANRSKSTFDRMLRHLKRFAKYTGKRMKVADLSQAQMNDWIRQDYASSSTTYQNDAIGAVVVAINRAGVGNPIAGMEKPTRQQRDFYLEPNQWETLLNAIPDPDFRDYCNFALHTGARPQETKAVEARHYDKPNSRIVFPKSEAKGKRRPRYIYLDDVAREIVERRKRKEGPVFLNQRGRPWTKDSVNCRFRRLKPKLGMRMLEARSCTYGARIGHPLLTRSDRA